MSKHASLICYIGNGVIKGAIAIVDKKKNPIILTTRVRELAFHDFIDRSHLEHRVMAEFAGLIKDIKFKDLTSEVCKGVVLKNACIILSSPWYVSETKIIKIEEEKPFTVTSKMINGAIASSAAGYIQKQKGVSLLEQNVIRYSLNGYHTSDPIKKEAQHLELSVFLSYCMSATTDNIKRIILSNLGVHDVSINSQSLAAFVTVRETWKDVKNYVLTDISSQLTELMIVRNGALAEAASFPMGKQFVVKELGKQLGTSPEVSQTLLSMYKDKTIEESLKTRVDNALASIRQAWLSPFTKALGEMSVGLSLPSRFFLFSPKDAEWLFADFIKSEGYQQFTFSEGKFEVYEAKVSDFEHSYEIKENATRDISLAVGTIFLHKKLEGVI